MGPGEVDAKGKRVRIRRLSVVVLVIVVVIPLASVFLAVVVLFLVFLPLVFIVIVVVVIVVVHARGPLPQGEQLQPRAGFVATLVVPVSKVVEADPLQALLVHLGHDHARERNARAADHALHLARAHRQTLRGAAEDHGQEGAEEPVELLVGEGGRRGRVEELEPEGKLGRLLPLAEEAEARHDLREVCDVSPQFEAREEGVENVEDLPVEPLPGAREHEVVEAG
mmetsp:Transcript_3953/g.7475  ORF Transcript_3953/g.7475 Transcript_3953/m.7475 type:complete len:225 (+) Transcript_3953:679-1353(+)